MTACRCADGGRLIVAQVRYTCNRLPVASIALNTEWCVKTYLGLWSRQNTSGNGAVLTAERDAIDAFLSAAQTIQIGGVMLLMDLL